MSGVDLMMWRLMMSAQVPSHISTPTAQASQGSSLAGQVSGLLMSASTAVSGNSRAAMRITSRSSCVLLGGISLSKSVMGTHLDAITIRRFGGAAQDVGRRRAQVGALHALHVQRGG